MVDYICIGLFELRETESKRELRNQKYVYVYIFLEHSAENKRHVLLLLFVLTPCAIELTRLRDCEMLSITTTGHINHDFIYLYIPWLYLNAKKRILRLNLIYITFLFSIYMETYVSK